jgi:hypothetical protein
MTPPPRLHALAWMQLSVKDGLVAALEADSLSPWRAAGGGTVRGCAGPAGRKETPEA